MGLPDFVIAFLDTRVHHGNTGMNLELTENEKSVCKALVALFGPTEAARQLGIGEGAMKWRAKKFGWKKATVTAPMTRDIGDIIKTAVERSHQLSTVHLAQYTEQAAIKAAASENPLEIARKVKDVAGVYSTLWPNKKEGKLIEGEILIGMASVKDEDPFARVEKPVEGREVDEPLREELPDQ